MTLVERTFAIDVRAVIRARPGSASRWSLRVRLSAPHGWQAIQTLVEVDLPGRQLVVADAGAGGQKVRLESTRPHFGGVRWWARCPMCTARVALLHRPTWASNYGCRKCFRLAYETAVASPSRRAALRAVRLRHRLGASPIPGGAIPPKPPRMRWSKFEALREAVLRADRRCETEFHARLERLFGRPRTDKG